MKKVCIIAFSLIFLVCVNLSAESYSAVKTLTIEGAARAVGMGDAFTSVSGEPFSSAYNPAATFGLEKITANLGYNTLWENTRIETGYISFKKMGAVVTGGIKYWANDNLELRTGPTTEFVEGSAHDLSIKAGASFELDSVTVIGFNVGMIYEKIEQYDGMALNFDLGFVSSMIPNVKFGGAVVNFGSTLNLREESFDLPTTYRAGFSYYLNNATVALDAVYLEDKLHAHTGVEYKIKDLFCLRGGYRSGYDSNDISAGFGIVKRNLRIDYAFLPYGNNLNDSHIFNLTFEI